VVRPSAHLLAALGLLLAWPLFADGARVRAETVGIAARSPAASLAPPGGGLTRLAPWQEDGAEWATGFGDDSDPPEQGEDVESPWRHLFPTSPADHGPFSSQGGGTGGTGGPSGGSAGPEVGIASSPRVSIPVFAARFLPEDGARDLISTPAHTFRPPRSGR
jgi:hypothetical protein